MSRIVLSMVAIAALTTGCASSSSQNSALQLPGGTVRNGLEVPPDVDERPAQLALNRSRATAE